MLPIQSEKGKAGALTEKLGAELISHVSWFVSLSFRTKQNGKEFGVFDMNLIGSYSYYWTYGS